MGPAIRKKGHASLRWKSVHQSAQRKSTSRSTLLTEQQMACHLTYVHDAPALSSYSKKHFKGRSARRMT